MKNGNHSHMAILAVVRESCMAVKKYWKISRVVMVITSENIEFTTSGRVPSLGQISSYAYLMMSSQRHGQRVSDSPSDV